nr:MAG TPA: hypothetical protein [Crassvirales sp.]
MYLLYRGVCDNITISYTMSHYLLLYVFLLFKFYS